VRSVIDDESGGRVRAGGRVGGRYADCEEAEDDRGTRLGAEEGLALGELKGLARERDLAAREGGLRESNLAGDDFWLSIVAIRMDQQQGPMEHHTSGISCACA